MTHIHSALIFTDSASQDRIPNLDGGEGCSEYIIHGTNIDIGESRAAESQQQQSGEQQTEVEAAATKPVEVDRNEVEDHDGGQQSVVDGSEATDHESEDNVKNSSFIN